jgi:ketol-acid reductoisomerase
MTDHRALRKGQIVGNGKIYRDEDADLAVLDGQRVAVVGYGNQGRSWALNLRDSGLDVRVCVRADDSRDQAERDGFATGDLDAANDADVVCVLVPDEVIPELPLDPRGSALIVVASGYTLAYDRFDPGCDLGMVAPRMLGPEVRECYEEGIGFVSAVGVHADRTGTAQARTLAIARAIGALRQGGIALDTAQEALLDLAVEQVLAPALRRINLAFTSVLMERGIPLEGILAELFLSGEMERTMRLLRLDGYAAQMAHHSPASQYGQLSRAPRFDHLEVEPVMRELLDDIESGRFADEWDAEWRAGGPTLERLVGEALGSQIRAFEADLRARLGERSIAGAADV